MKYAVIMLLVISFPSCSLSQTLRPEQVGQQMFQAAGPTHAMDNMQNTTPEQHATAILEWKKAFEESVGKSPDAANLMFLIPKMGELYVNGKFQPAKSSEMAGRMKSVSKEMVNAWREVLGRFQSVDDVNLIWFMVRQPTMFTGSTLKPDIASRQLKRLQSLPEDAVLRWEKITESDKGPSALSLIEVDALFKTTVFQQGMFDAALPHAQKLVQEFNKKK